MEDCLIELRDANKGEEPAFLVILTPAALSGDVVRLLRRPKYKFVLFSLVFDVDDVDDDDDAFDAVLGRKY